VNEDDPKAKAVHDAAIALIETIKANAPDCANRQHAIALIGDALHCAYYATSLADEETDTPGVPA